MYPEYIVKKLRGRRNLEDFDGSQDEAIHAMPPQEAFREVVAWELGDPEWGRILIEWARDCGYEIAVKG